MVSRLSLRRIKVPMFLGCEGSSEVAFGTFLNGLCQRQGRDVFLKTHDAAGGGPLNVVESSVRARSRLERGSFQKSFLLVDTDRFNATDARYAAAIQLAARQKFELIYSRPCIEGLVFRIITERHGGRVTRDEAIRHIQPTWPRFGEGALTAREITSRITLKQLRSYAAFDGAFGQLLETLQLHRD